MADYYPDDGSIKFEHPKWDDEPEPQPQGGWFFKRFAFPVDLIRCIPGIVIQFVSRSWTDGDTVPDWPALTDANISHFTLENAIAQALCTTEITKATVEIEPGVYVTKSARYFMQMKWRLAWPLPSLSRAEAFRYVDLRYRLQLVDITGLVIDWDTVPIAELSPVDVLWNDGDVAEDYDVTQPHTWPGTDWAEQAVATDPTVADPGLAPPTFGTNAVRIRCLWPGRRFLADASGLAFTPDGTSNDATGGMGRIPGGPDECYMTRRPRADGGSVVAII